MVYKNCDREYAKQVTAEHKVNVKNGNKTTQVWKLKTSHADNHYLDCEVYCLAAADILGVRSLHLNNIEEASKEQTQSNVAEENFTPEENWVNNNEGWI